MGVDHTGVPFFSVRHQTVSFPLTRPVPKMNPPATDGELYPPPTPSTVHSFLGPSFGHSFSSPVCDDTPSRFGPRHCGQSVGPIFRSAAGWPLVRDSWRRRDPSLCTRFDLACDRVGPAKLHECNGDTPGTLFESAVFQWIWLEDQLAAGGVPAAADQFNRLHPALVAACAALPGAGGPIHFAASTRNLEDGVWVRYLADCASQAGRDAVRLDIEAIGADDGGTLTDLEDRAIACLVKAYRWELLLREPFGRHLAGPRAPLLVEPAWKLVLSSKGLLVWLWRLFPGHPNLLPCWFAGDPAAPADRVVVKPLFSIKGHNIRLRDPALPGGEIRTGGTYGRQGQVVQALHRLPVFPRPGGEGHASLMGWIVGDRVEGMAVMESDGPIVHDATSRFVPHIVLP